VCVQSEKLEGMSWDYDCNCAGSLAAPVSNLYKREMETTGSYSLEVEIEERASAKEVVLK
jgi:hypothetical protein